MGARGILHGLVAVTALVPSHHRELQTQVSTSAGLTSALANTAVGHIVLASGTYILSAELSITRSIVLEAVVAGSCVLHAQASSSNPRRVLNINPGSTGVVQLIGLNITGGYVTNNGGGVYIYSGTVTLSSCTITGNSVAHYGGGVLIAGIGKVTLSSCIITGNSAYSATNTGNNPTNNGGGGVAVFTTGGTVAILSSNISGNIVAGQNSVRAHAQTFPWP